MARLRTTTVRFDEDSWGDLCREADRLGVSRSQYIREAAQARVARESDRPGLRELDRRVAEVEHNVSMILGVLRRQHLGRRW